MEKILGILRFAYAREIEGREFYKEKSSRVINKDVKEIIESLWKMEDDHVKFIKSLMEKVEHDESVEIETPVIKSDFFESKEKSEMLSGSVDELANDMSILRMAYLIEEDFEEFYRTSAKKVEDIEMKKILNMLADWEDGHKNMLMDAYNDAMKTYWSKQGFEPLF
ncbi:MAG TPA: ferritin family protein [Fervidobacterium sp.]|nr:ferritin family protein [Fervidobacterium sp.]HPT54680.1 ferritin family protein [Fervidobacterium sp.]HPZ18093.1 ferritin family protein [Fervidobacterium sp.]HQE49359.1 ferritin family protein [Fervidobacterium sp.]HUM43146.1 ferritin family protein [Fervidobacterium sp.]